MEEEADVVPAGAAGEARGETALRACWSVTSVAQGELLDALLLPLGGKKGLLLIDGRRKAVLLASLPCENALEGTHAIVDASGELERSELCADGK